MKLAALIAKDLVFPLAGCEQASDVLGIYKYRRVVGYYENDKEAWFAG